MNRKGFKSILLASLVLAAIGFFAASANAGWWWGAAPAGCCGDGWPQSCDCGSWGGCGACGGGGWYGAHHGAHHGCLSCGCGYGFYSGCGGCSSCYNNWGSSCGGCGSCCGGWSGYGTWTPSSCSTCGTVVSSCGCGGMMTGMGTTTYTGSATMAAPTGPSIPTPAPPATGTIPAPSTAPSAPGPAPPLSTPSTPASPSTPALPSLSTPATPEGGLPLPGGHGASLEQTGADGCLLTIWVPYEAKVTINGMATKSVGSRRQFVSYGLKPGFSYSYEVVAKIVREGKELTESKTISLTAGGRDGVAFGFNVIPEGQTASN